MLFNVIVYPKIFVQVVAEMLAIGYGLPKDAFTSLMKQVTYSILNSSACFILVSTCWVWPILAYLIYIELFKYSISLNTMFVCCLKVIVFSPLNYGVKLNTNILSLH